MDNNREIKILFKEYNRNLNKLAKLKESLKFRERFLEVVYEKESDYISKKEFLSVKDEKRRLEDEVEDLYRKINLRNLLFIQLDDEAKEIFTYVFDKYYSVDKICDILYISQSSYYRKMREIYRNLNEYYKSFKQLFE
ncbi:helix-turn-helix domain-containing protein [Peptoniphilaceae bacterium SGI.131]